MEKKEEKVIDHKEAKPNNKKKIIIIISIVLGTLLILGLVLFLVLRNKKITITFDSDGGTTVEVQKIKKGGTINIPESTKEGFTLDGWFIDEQRVTSTTTFNKNTTVKAKWTTAKPKSFKVTFDSKEGSPVEPIEVECNKELTLPENPTKEGYIFVSWVDKNETPILDDALLACEDITLYANWQEKDAAKKYYTVKFDSKGGSNVNSIQVECNTKLKLPTKKPSRTGYEFVSWADKNGKVILDGALLSCENITLYANWKKVDGTEKKYMTITFDSKGGSSVSSMKVECDKALSTLPTPTRKGYSFIAWYDKNGKTILSGALLSCENITLYADWSENKPETPEKQYKCPTGYTLSEDKKKCTLSVNPIEECETGSWSEKAGVCYKWAGNPTKSCNPYKGYETGKYFDNTHGAYGCAYGSRDSYPTKQVCQQQQNTVWDDASPSPHCWNYVVRGDSQVKNTCSNGTSYHTAVDLGGTQNSGCYTITQRSSKCESGYTLKDNKCIKTVDSVYE